MCCLAPKIGVVEMPPWGHACSEPSPELPECLLGISFLPSLPSIFTLAGDLDTDVNIHAPVYLPVQLHV